MLYLLFIIVLVASFMWDAEWLLDRHFDKKVIVNCDRDAYLNRWFIIRTKHIALFVHKFVRSDEDRALHDHPWAFFVIPIWQGYIEHSDRELRDDERTRLLELMGTRVPIVRRVFPVISARYRDTTYRHRVELLNDAAGNPRPSWSLFFRFTKVRDWGFWLPTGFMLNNKWWREKCE